MRLRRILMFLQAISRETLEESLERPLFAPTRHQVPILGGRLLINAEHARFVEGDHRAIPVVELHRRMWKYYGNTFKFDEWIRAVVQQPQGKQVEIPKFEITDLDPIEGFWACVTGRITTLEDIEFDTSPQGQRLTQPLVHVDAEIIEFEIDPQKLYTFVEHLDFDGGQ